MAFRVCNGEIPPCSFETARRLLWRNTNNELLPVYDRQLCEWYLQTQILRCEWLGDNKWFHWSLSSSLKFEGKAQLSLKFEWRTQIWVTNSNLSETVWYPPDLSEPSNLSDHPELRESRQITQNWVLHLILRVVIYLIPGFWKLVYVIKVMYGMIWYVCLCIADDTINPGYISLAAN